MPLELDFISHFAAEVSINGKDAKREVIGVALCDNSVSLTRGNVIIHVPWMEIARWISELARATETT